MEATEQSPYRVVVGTAGHIDHGKSSLVEALTGVDPDRLAEEKRRGITIELGFAPLPLPGVGQVGLVDVPGHERFVRTMAAGAAGVDLLLLVVAVDEGVMPQTREHLDVARLLGIERRVVALTKVDLLDRFEPGWLDLVRSDVERCLAEDGAAAGAIVPVSARTGEGLDALREALAKEVPKVQPRAADGPPFLPIDRVFTQRGHGTIVTGTLLSGRVQVDETLSLWPSGRPVRVRGVQVHGSPVAEARAGQRTALNLAGVSHEAVRRGEVLAFGDPGPAGAVFDVEVTLLPAAPEPVRHRSRWQLLLGTAHAEATLLLLDRPALAPGERAFAQLELPRPLAALPGQRFLLRGGTVLPGRGRTLAGGRILYRAQSRRRRGHTEGLAGLADPRPEARVEAALRLAGFTGLSESELAQRLGLAPRQVTRAAEALLAAGRARLAAKAPRTLLHAESALRLEARLLARVEVAQRGGAVLGVPAESVRQGLPGPPPRRLFERLVARLVAAGRLRREGDLLASPAIPTALQGAEAEWAKGARAALAQAGLRPPRTAELARALGCPPQRLEDLLCRLEAEGHLVRVQGDLFFDRGAIDALRGRLLAHLEAHGRISTQEFKAMTGATRKHAIPLAEYFDQTRVTLRVGDARIARKGRR